MGWKRVFESKRIFAGIFGSFEGSRFRTVESRGRKTVFAVEKQDGGFMNILVVDDELPIVRGIVKILEMEIPMEKNRFLRHSDGIRRFRLWKRRK